MTKISEAIDKNDYTLGVFLDLAKAFDTVNHEILPRKLDHYGVRGTVNEWKLLDRKKTDSKIQVGTIRKLNNNMWSAPLFFVIYRI